jgi:hypothetical protein
LFDEWNKPLSLDSAKKTINDKQLCCGITCFVRLK